MPEGVDYASANVTAGTGLEINYVQDRVFAYSGVFAPDGANESTMLSFQTGDKTIEGQFQFFYATDTKQEQDCLYKIKINGLVIGKFINEYDIRQGIHPPVPIPVIIPPYSLIEATCEMETSSQSQAVMFTGKTL